MLTVLGCAALAVVAVAGLAVAVDWRRVARVVRRDEAAEAAEVARACDRPDADGAVVLAPWDYSLPEVVLVEIARARGLEPDPVERSWAWSPLLRLRPAGERR